MDLQELRRAVGARLGYCFRNVVGDYFAWHVRFPDKRVLSYTGDAMADIPRWSEDSDAAIKLCEEARKAGLFMSLHYRPSSQWACEAWHQPADVDTLVLLERSESEASTLAEAICKTFCLVMSEVDQE